MPGMMVISNETGYARFDVADDASYVLTVKEEGGFEAVTAKPVSTHR